MFANCSPSLLNINLLDPFYPETTSLACCELHNMKVTNHNHWTLNDVLICAGHLKRLIHFKNIWQVELQCIDPEVLSVWDWSKSCKPIRTHTHCTHVEIHGPLHEGPSFWAWREWEEQYNTPHQTEIVDYSQTTTKIQDHCRYKTESNNNNNNNDKHNGHIEPSTQE